MAPKKPTKSAPGAKASSSTSKVAKTKKQPTVEGSTRVLRPRAAKVAADENLLALASGAKAKNLTQREKEREDVERQVDELIAEESKPRVKTVVKKEARVRDKAEEKAEKKKSKSTRSGIVKRTKKYTEKKIRSTRSKGAHNVEIEEVIDESFLSSGSTSTPDYYDTPNPLMQKGKKAAIALRRSPRLNPPASRFEEIVNFFRRQYHAALPPYQSPDNPNGYSAYVLSDNHTTTGSEAPAYSAAQKRPLHPDHAPFLNPASPDYAVYSPSSSSKSITSPISPSRTPHSPISHHLLHSSTPLQTPLTPRVDWGTVVDHEGNLLQSLPFEGKFASPFAQRMYNPIRSDDWDYEKAEKEFVELLKTGIPVKIERNHDAPGWWPRKLDWDEIQQERDGLAVEEAMRGGKGKGRGLAVDNVLVLATDDEWDEEKAEEAFYELLDTGKAVQVKKNENGPGWWPEIADNGWTDAQWGETRLKLEKAWNDTLVNADWDQEKAEKIFRETLKSGKKVEKTQKESDDDDGLGWPQWDDIEQFADALWVDNHLGLSGVEAVEAMRTLRERRMRDEVGLKDRKEKTGKNRKGRSRSRSNERGKKGDSFKEKGRVSKSKSKSKSKSRSKAKSTATTTSSQSDPQPQSRSWTPTPDDTLQENNTPSKQRGPKARSFKLTSISLKPTSTRSNPTSISVKPTSNSYKATSKLPTFPIHPTLTQIPNLANFPAWQNMYDPSVLATFPGLPGSAVRPIDTHGEALKKYYAGISETLKAREKGPMSTHVEGINKGPGASSVASTAAQPSFRSSSKKDGVRSKAHATHNSKAKAKSRTRARSQTRRKYKRTPRPTSLTHISTSSTVSPFPIKSHLRAVKKHLEDVYKTMEGDVDKDTEIGKGQEEEGVDGEEREKGKGKKKGEPGVKYTKSVKREMKHVTFSTPDVGSGSRVGKRSDKGKGLRKRKVAGKGVEEKILKVSDAKKLIGVRKRENQKKKWKAKGKKEKL